MTIDKTLTKVVQQIGISVPDNGQNYVVVHGTVWGDMEMMRYHMLPPLESSYHDDLIDFGMQLSAQGVHVEIVVMVVHGMLPNHMMRPASIMLAQSRNGEIKQIVYDHKKKEVIQTESINQADLDNCTAVYIGQNLYKPELEGIQWN